MFSLSSCSVTPSCFYLTQNVCSCKVKLVGWSCTEQQLSLLFLNMKTRTLLMVLGKRTFSKTIGSPQAQNRKWSRTDTPVRKPQTGLYGARIGKSLFSSRYHELAALDRNFYVDCVETDTYQDVSTVCELKRSVNWNGLLLLIKPCALYFVQGGTEKRGDVGFMLFAQGFWMCRNKSSSPGKTSSPSLVLSRS